MVSSIRSLVPCYRALQSRPFSALATTFFGGDDPFSPFFGSDRSIVRAIAGTGDERQLRGISLDVVEKPKQFDIKADIPSVDKKDIKLNVEGNVLTISVQKEENRQEENNEAGVKWHRSERSLSFASRALRLPENADLGNVKATYAEGVLSVEVPKNEKLHPHTIEVE